MSNFVILGISYFPIFNYMYIGACMHTHVCQVVYTCVYNLAAPFDVALTTLVHIYLINNL